ncbi:MAG: hypothetical protein ABEJ98_06020 [Candidatus Nanohaloarchaea archaeon]
MARKIEDYFPSEEAEAAESVIEVFHDDMLIDPSLKDTEKILLCTYMKANEHESNLIDKTEVREMFENMGGEGDSYSKSVYDLVNRRNPERLKEKDDKIGLTFHGRKKVKEIIGADEDEQ